MNRSRAVIVFIVIYIIYFYVYFGDSDLILGFN